MGVPRLSDTDLATIEQRYRITLRDDERVLLTSALLTGLEAQLRYVLQCALNPHRCPGCNGVICQRSAFPDFKPGGSSPDLYKCPYCRALLLYRVSLFAGHDWFSLAPGQTVTITDQPPGGTA